MLNFLTEGRGFMKVSFYGYGSVVLGKMQSCLRWFFCLFAADEWIAFFSFLFGILTFMESPEFAVWLAACLVIIICICWLQFIVAICSTTVRLRQDVCLSQHHCQAHCLDVLKSGFAWFWKLVCWFLSLRSGQKMSENVSLQKKRMFFIPCSCWGFIRV